MTNIKSMLSKWYQLYVKRPAARIEFSRPVWMFLNRKPHKLYLSHEPRLDSVQERIVREMRKDGVSVTHFDELFKDEPKVYADILAKLPEYLSGAKQDPKKPHFKDLWDPRTFRLDPDSPFTAFALSKRVLDIANSYLRMWSRLHMSNGYLSVVQPEDSARMNTQNWHRDAHDVQLVSVFIYLTDVLSEADGALSYMKESQPLGRFGKVMPQPKPYSEKSKIVPEEVLMRRIPSENRAVVTGRKGTIVFTDGTGIHRGGYCTRNARVMVLTAYASDHRYSDFVRLSYPEVIDELKSKLPPEAVFAAGLENK